VYDDVVGGEGEVSKFVAGIYGSIGCEVDLFAIEPGRENAVGVLKGAGGGRSLIYNGHVDVVPPGDPANWTSGSPFSGKIDADRVWGRGSTDMKSGILAQAFAARALVECDVRLAGDLILEAVVGEEVMDHECGVTATVKRGYTADAAVVSEPSSPPAPLAIVPVSPGLLWFSVTVPGKASHASMRANTFRAGGLGASVAVNAIDKGVDLYLAIRRLEDEWGQSKRHPLFPPGHFTIHPGVVTGGPKGVLVPFFISEYMTIEYCCWYHPDDDPEDVKREIETHVERAAQLDSWLREHPPVVEWKLNWPPFSVDPDHPICHAIGDAHERAAVGTRFAGRPETHGFAAVEDVSFLNLGGVTAVSYGPGDLRVAHADDEYVLIDELVTAAKTYAILAMAWCGHT
jgi:acetylornithine deacetylase